MEEGETRQFQQDVVAQVPSLLAVARRLCRNDTDAEDLVHDTVIRAIRARKQFQAGTNMRAWLLKIQRNSFINRYHRTALERAATNTTPADPVIDGWMSSASMRAMRDPDGFVVRPQLADALTSAIDKLPHEFREVVLLADAEELAYREIAEILDCPIGTVMSRLHRGRRLLKAELIQHARDLGIVQAEETVTDSRATEKPSEPITLDEYRINRTTNGRKQRGKGSV
jgi:RNA polymerase sigma-70 factor, ECF subfamily